MDQCVPKARVGHGTFPRAEDPGAKSVPKARDGPGVVDDVGLVENECEKNPNSRYGRGNCKTGSQQLEISRN